MDSCEQHNSIIQGVITCMWMETVMHKNKWGDNKVFSRGHHNHKRTLEEWSKISRGLGFSSAHVVLRVREKTRPVTGLLWKRLLSQWAIRAL